MTPASPPPRRDGSRRRVAGQVAQFALAGLLAAALVVVATFVVSRRVGEREAITDARNQTAIDARGLVQPVTTDGLTTSDPQSLAAVDLVVRRGVIDDSVIRVKIWRRDGTIVYSDEPRLIGTRYALGEEERDALRAGSVEAEVSDLSKPENRFERKYGKLLEVYLPITAPNGERMLFETYTRYDAVAENGARVWRAFAPIMIIAILLVALVQIPLAWRLARRLEQRQAERERLLQLALEASDMERRRIAADLHDGVVQNLAGVAFGVGATARNDDVGPASAAVLDESAGELRESIKAMRSLLVEIYPANLAEEGLPAALTDLLARATGRGIETSLDTDDLDPDLSIVTAGIVYRVTQEALRNTLSHARATRIDVVAYSDDRAAVVTIVDDGVGFVPAEVENNPSTGHFGITGMSSLVADAGGSLSLESAPGRGTRIRVEVPL